MKRFIKRQIKRVLNLIKKGCKRIGRSSKTASRRIFHRREEFLKACKLERLNWMDDEKFLKTYARYEYGVRLDLKHPRTFTEKMNWLKLHDHNPQYHVWADKYEAKKRIARLLGDDHVIPCYGVWDSFDEIDFDSLPHQFVLKCTHDSGSIRACKDRNSFDFEEAREYFHKKMRRKSYYYHKREWAYKCVRPRIIAEAYVPELMTYGYLEYNSLCFNGRAEYINVYNGKSNWENTDDWRSMLFDRNGCRVPARIQYGALDGDAALPPQIRQMIEWSDMLSNGMPFVRVDWYLIDNRIIFGEMTFYFLAGFVFLDPPEWNTRMGDLIDIKPVLAQRDDDKKRLMFIVPNLHGGGAERVVSRLANRLCDSYKVYVYCTSPTMECEYELDPRVEVEDYQRRRTYKKRNDQLYFRDQTEQCRRKKTEWNIDYAISFLRSANYINAASRVREKQIVSVRCICSGEPFADEEERTRSDKMIRFAAAKSDLLVGVSKLVSEEQISIYNADTAKVRTIYNPIDAKEMQAGMSEHLNDIAFEAFAEDKNFLFITAGRMTEQKGQWHLLRAFKDIAVENPSAGLVVLGNGPLENYLKGLVQSFGISDNVYFCGYTRQPFAYYSRCNAFVFPSMAEGFPNALLEAMACRLPVISCDCDSGPRELLAPETDVHTKTLDMEITRYGILIPVVSGFTGSVAWDKEPEEEMMEGAMCLLMADSDLRQQLADAGSKGLEILILTG